MRRKDYTDNFKDLLETPCYGCDHPFREHKEAWAHNYGNGDLLPKTKNHCYTCDWCNGYKPLYGERKREV
jgi:hypothetical protein